MPLDVPGYGRFTPGLPDWLRLGADGKLYNVNAADPTQPWVPPAGYVGSDDFTFVPEAALDAVREFVAALKELSQYHRAVLAAVEADVERRRERFARDLDAELAVVRVTRSVVDKFDAALAVLGR